MLYGSWKIARDIGPAVRHGEAWCMGEAWRGVHIECTAELWLLLDESLARATVLLKVRLHVLYRRDRRPACLGLCSCHVGDERAIVFANTTLFNDEAPVRMYRYATRRR